MWVAILAAIGLESGAAAAEWPHHREIGRFVCRADFPLETVETLLADLQQLQADLTADLGLPAANEWIELYLFRDKPTYLGYMSKQFPGVPYRRALYMKSRGQGRVFAYLGPEVETDVRHECTHALLHAVLPMVPLWLDEGLAEYYEVPRANRKQDRSRPWNPGGTRRPLPTLVELEAKRDVSEMGLDEYHAAWTWAYFMLHGPAEARGELLQFLEDIRAQTPPGQLSVRLRTRLPDLDDRYAAFRRG